MTSCNNKSGDGADEPVETAGFCTKDPNTVLRHDLHFHFSSLCGKNKWQILKLGQPSLPKPPYSAWGELAASELAELWGTAWGKPGRTAFTFYTSGPSTPLLSFLSLKSYALCLRRTILEEAAHKSKWAVILLFPLLCVLRALSIIGTLCIPVKHYRVLLIWKVKSPPCLTLYLRIKGDSCLGRQLHLALTSPLGPCSHAGRCFSSTPTPACLWSPRGCPSALVVLRSSSHA